MEKNFDFVLMDRFLSELPSNKARASAVVIAWGMHLAISLTDRVGSAGRFARRF